MRARTVAFALTAALLFYFFLLGERAIIMIRDGRLAFVLLGIGVLLLPIVGAWTIWRELALGINAQRLARLLSQEELRKTDFVDAKAIVEQSPEDWRAWYSLAMAYGDAGDTKNGRAAMRNAVDLESKERGSKRS